MRFFLLVLCFSFGVMPLIAQAKTDSIPIVIKNSRTGNTLDWEHQLTFYFPEDSVQVSKSVSPELFPVNGPIRFRLQVYQHEFNGLLRAEMLQDLYAFLFYLNFDEENSQKCNKIYWVTADATGLAQVDLPNVFPFEAPCKCLPANEQRLHLIHRLFGDAANGDFMENYFASLDGAQQKWEGLYQIHFSEEYHLQLLLKDSTEAKVQLFQKGKIIQETNGLWIYDSNQQLVQLSTISPFIFSLGDGQVMNLNNCYLQPPNEESTSWLLYSYGLREGTTRKTHYKVLEK